MIKTIYITILSFLFSLIAISQEFGKSYIYNDSGQLIVDTTFKISLKQFKVWRFAENNIVGCISSKIDYSPIAKDAGIAGRLIIAFDCDTDAIKNISIITKKLGGGLDENVLIGLKNASKDILIELKNGQYIAHRLSALDDGAYFGRYYVPIDFSLISLMNEVKKKNAVPILRTGIFYHTVTID